MTDIEAALSAHVKDGAIRRHFLSVWPVIEMILEAFSKATRLPIFVYWDGVKVFQSSAETMPAFCSAMLASREMALRCVHDGGKRALLVEPEITEGVQLCHAGMLNGRCEIDVSVGRLVVLFGSVVSTAEEALKRRGEIVALAAEQSEAMAARLRSSDSPQERFVEIAPSGASLMNAIKVIIERLVDATVEFRSLTINMAHELSLIMVGLGLLAKLEELEPQDEQESKRVRAHIVAESKLGLYVVRNFLSHASEDRYRQAVRTRFSELDLAALVLEMIDLHQLKAHEKGLVFDATGLNSTPKIKGHEEEIRRLLHNVLSNAVKYSYRSVHDAQRVIRVKSRVPYDPGYRSRRLSIRFENYGLGLMEQETALATKPGFRGAQAVAEVPIGSGIGLSEAHKIMRLHGGDMKISSRALHESTDRGATYLTAVDLIFPY